MSGYKFIVHLREKIENMDYLTDREKFDLLGVNVHFVSRYPQYFEDEILFMRAPVWFCGGSEPVIAFTRAMKTAFSLEVIVEKKEADKSFTYLDEVCNEYHAHLSHLRDVVDDDVRWCPYIPLHPFRAADPTTYAPVIGFKTRYGLVDRNGNPINEDMKKFVNEMFARSTT